MSGPAAAALPARSVLPHRPPFLFVDEVVELVPGGQVRARWHLTGEEWFFAGHFPGRPTLPGVLMCEAIAQVGAIAVLTDPRFAGRLPLFGGLDSARFRRQVGPGDTLDLEVSWIACRPGRARAPAGPARRQAGLRVPSSCSSSSTSDRPAPTAAGLAPAALAALARGGSGAGPSHRCDGAAPDVDGGIAAGPLM